MVSWIMTEVLKKKNERWEGREEAEIPPEAELM